MLIPLAYEVFTVFFDEAPDPAELIRVQAYSVHELQWIQSDFGVAVSGLDVDVRRLVAFV